ncbi:MAG: MFS transporter [Oscillospiraceae bacterium]|nr:MFS transporter [Oscillospiraceae bacterium]
MARNPKKEEWIDVTVTKLLRKNPDGEQKEKLFSKDYILVMISGTGQGFTNHFFAAILVLYVEGILGGTVAQAGILGMMYSITALAARLTAGGASDKFGRVKLLVGGTFLCAVACLLFGLAHAIPALIIIRAFHGFGFGIAHTCAGAVVADVLPKARMSEGIGYFGLGNTLAQAIGPAIAIAVISGGEAFHFRLLFFISAGLCFIGMIANACVSYERKQKATLALAQRQLEEAPVTEAATVPAEPDEPQSEGKAFLGFDRAVFAPILVLVVMFLGVTSTVLFLIPFATTVLGIANPGPYFAVRAAGVFISRLVFGRIADKRGSDIIIIPGMIIMVACLALIPFASSFGMLIAIGFPHGMAQGAVMPTFNSLILSRCSPARRGSAAGAFGASIDIGFSVGAPLQGLLADIYSLQFVFWVSAILVAISLVMFLFIASDKRYKAKLARVKAL